MSTLPPKPKGKKQEDVATRCTWNDHNTEIFVKLCVEQVKAGNRPGTHLTKEGWKTVVEKFRSATGSHYDKPKLKNRWDNLKRDWKLWNELVRSESGLGRNVITGAIEATEKWWADKIARSPDTSKFRYRPLQNADDLEIIFADITSTGEWGYTPSSGQMPSFETRNGVFEEQCVDIDDDAEGDGDGDAVGDGDGDGDAVGDGGLTPDDDVVMHPSDLTGKRSRGRNNSQGSKKKRSNSNGLIKTLNRLVDVAEASSASSIQSKKGGHSIAECLDKLRKIDGINENEHFVWAARMFLRSEHRELFLNLQTDELRLTWLNLEIALEKSKIPGYRE